MVSLFMQVFSCCLGRRSQESDITDDRSRLIPATTEPSLENQYGTVLIDQGKFQERLNSIVRDKEGKMVNVTSRLPFNLYNRTLAGQGASSSRSASSAHERPSSQSYRPPTWSGPQTAPTYSAERSSSRKTSRSGSPSSVSSRRGRAVRSIDGQTDVDEPVTPKPILNVRLIRHCGSPVAGRRGRARLKVGDTSQLGYERKEGGLDADPQSGVSIEPPVVRDELGGTTPSISSGDEGVPTVTLHGNHPNASSSPCSFPQLSVSPASDIDFRIEDMGAITLSWDD